MTKFKNVRSAIRLVLLTLLSVVYLVPVIMMVLGSFKDQAEASQFDLSLPAKFLFENYVYVFERGNILSGYWNSFLTTGMATVFVLLFGSLTGIYVGRSKTRLSEGVYNYFIIGLMLCFQTATTFSLLSILKLYGTSIGVSLIYTAMQLPFTVMTFSSFIKGIPREIDEAGFIDGCNAINLIFRVLLPVMKPIFVTNLIIVAINCWNNFMIPLFYLNSSTKWTIPLMVYNFYGRYERNWNYVFAILVITILPIVILYLCLQKHIVEGMTSGAVKG
ncbi:MAG: carbohydrate ABC transporter permease [Eubacteriales bacterium]